MKFGSFYELQMPRPWAEGSEHKLIKNALDQAELCDKAGYDYIWATEHHFLEEYAHSSAPEVFLAAASQRTKNVRIGHGIVQMPSNINHPARVPEDEKKAMMIEGARAVADMLTQEPFAGLDGKYLKIPSRNVVPKPLQKPHPPMWLACSNRTSILQAAKLGLGALTFSFVGAEQARQWVADYY